MTRKQQKPKKIIYLSIDGEFDGPIPVDYSMLSFGVGAFDGDTGNLVDTFEANMYRLPNAKECPRTMEWWAKQPEAWEACHKDQQDPREAMLKYVTWQTKLIDDHKAKLCYIGYPVTVDFMWIHWYSMHFTGQDRAGFAGADIKTYASALLKKHHKKSTKRAMPKEWFSGGKHTHKAIDDAIEQGHLAMNILKKIGIIETVTEYPQLF